MSRWNVAVLILVLVLAAASAVRADVPISLSYQGILTDAAGKVIEDNTYTLRFSVFDVPVGSSPLFTQDLQVMVRDGLYNVILSGSNLATAFEGSPRYMEVARVEGSVATPFPPRQQIASVPSALTAARAIEITTPAPNPLPAGAIILWKGPGGCPAGFEQVTDFNNLAVRGADTANLRADIPNDPGRICDGAGVVDPACGAPPARYNDGLEVEELAEHSHQLIDDGGDGNGDKFDSGGDNGPNGTVVETQPAGAGAAHYHPFATVLFCMWGGS